MIVFPMAGLSSRFFKAGFKLPKYMLEAHGRRLFDYAVLGFRRYFNTEHFLFIARADYETPEFVKNRCEHLGIKQYSIVVLKNETRGQAETVYLGLKDIAKDEAVTIFNIDTFRVDFTQPVWLHETAGYLEVFKGEGDNWSYAKPESTSSNKVIETAEKNPISDLCSTGLYYFRTVELFNNAFEIEVNKPKDQWQKQELYIAPLYNYLIEDGQDVRYNLIEKDEVVFCGVPDEYAFFQKEAELAEKIAKQ